MVATEVFTMTLTFSLMLIGTLMVGVGCTFWLTKSINKGERGNAIFFLCGILFCLGFLTSLGKENSIFRYEIPFIITVRIIIFILGLLMIFSMLFQHHSVMDKIQKIFDKLRFR